MSKANVFSCIGASSHSKQERELLDYYATEPKAVELLLEKEKFSPNIWECCCGEGHISKVLEEKGYIVLSTDLVDRGYEKQKHTKDFLKINKKDLQVDVITNPPYKNALEFVKKAIEVVGEGQKVAMFLKLTFLEGKARKIFFETTPQKKYMYQVAG
ncbi:NAD(P)-dependent oxidoreductase [Parvimonas micra]|uniref:NAD(P)-dependent oxidoreductase n=1 Tax=Parvimonas micra TaxID=33033 RepID=UPI00241CB3C4|nr:NAD(P)-dependent oxidoreductase [Parvimonas micra]